MDRTSWKPKIYKATESVDYKAEEEGTSDGAKKGWLTRQRGGSAEEPKKDFVPIDWAGTVGSQQTEEHQDMASDLMDFGMMLEKEYGWDEDEIVKNIVERYGTNEFPQPVLEILEDENYTSLFKFVSGTNPNPETGHGGSTAKIPEPTPEPTPEPETQSSRDKEFYDQSTQNTLDTLNQSKVNGFPFFSYVGKPKQVISDGKGGIILYGMKRNPNSIRRVDVKYDEGRDTYTVSFMSNRNKPKGEYNDVYFDQLGGLIAGNKGLGVESYATEDDYKYDWDQLTSLAQKALSDIGYDKKSWNQEPEDIRKEMEKVAYSEENWKEVANKFYKEELNKGKKNGGEAMYGYGSATGRMSPVEAWNQGADVYGDMGYDQSLRNPIFTDFRGLQWNELPTDIQEAWKSELGYYTQGEGLVDNIEKQLNRFGVNLDRDPEQIEESNEADPCWKGYKQIGMKDKNGKQVPNCVPESNESVLEKVHVDGWEFSVIDDGYGGGSFGSTPNAGLLEVGIFAPKSGSKTMIGDSAIKGWLTPEEVDDLKRTFEVDPVMAYRRIGGDWEEDWQKGLESNANESYLVEWGYDLDYDFAEIDNLEDAKQKAIDKGGNVYLDNTLVYSVIPSKKIDPANDKSSFITANHLMNVESKANEYDCESCGGEYSKCPHCGHAMHDYEWEDSNDVCDSCEKGKYDESYSREGHRHRWVKEDETDFCLDCDEMRPTEYEMGAKGYDHGESKASEGFNQGLYGYVDAKCKTCGIEFDSIPDMDDHYAMNSDHISNLNDLDSDIPNSD
jgi:hypothetical protein